VSMDSVTKTGGKGILALFFLNAVAWLFVAGLGNLAREGSFE
jgi:hypothetical protein